MAEKLQIAERPVAAHRSPLALPTGAFVMAVAGAAAALLLAVIAGSPKLAAGGVDNDSLMRLVTVRDLLAGQAWFDPTQYRMGLDGGFAMHWSRLVDAPVALLVVIFGETAAAFIWPTLLLVAALYLILKIATRLGGPAARFPALVLGVTALHFMGIFQPGSFDHHNLQLVLVLVFAAGLLAGTLRGGLAAGAAAAVSLAIGIETLPLLAAAGLASALPFMLFGERDRAVGFGLGFAVLGALSLAAMQPLAGWWRTTCDAYSGGHAALAVVAGGGLAAAAMATAGHGVAARTTALAVVATFSIAVLLVIMPQCLGDPYAGLDPRLRIYWLDWIIEAQPIWSMIGHDPVQAATHYVTPLIALALAATGISGARAPRMSHALLLCVAVAVSWWQLRGAVFALALAVPPLAAWIAKLRTQTESAGWRLALAWIVSFNVAWGLAAQGVMRLTDAKAAQGAASETASPESCISAGDYTALAAEPASTVLAISNLGAPILAYTAHRALAGPYHRNQAGNLAVLDAFLGDAIAAREIIRANAVGIVAVCAGNDETQVLAQRAPDGLLAGLLAGREFGWLDPLRGSAPLRLYRVTGAIAP